LQSRSYLFLLIVLALGVISGIGYVKKEPNLGLDIVGGVRLTFSMDTSKLSEDRKQEMGSVRSTIVRTLTNRASGMGGATEAVVQPKGDDQVIVELPGFTDTQKATEYLKTTASIEWYDARNVRTGKGASRLYDTGTQVDYKGTPAFTFIKGSGTEILPGTPEYAAVIRSWGDPILVGDDLERADPEPSGDGYIPSMKFSPEGAKKMDRWSRRNMNTGAQIAAVMDGVVISIAPLADNTILSNTAQITGRFDKEYVFALTELLNSGSLPVSLKIESVQKVDPTIGKSALQKIIFAGLIAFALISVFLMVYYALPGFIAFLALCLYVLFTLTVLKLINATFSLAAIAGFILSVGMAVDANILVFERFKEEMKGGKSLHSAIELGFKRALPAIMDSNACTILTSLVLVNLGTGPVKGFASTLIIGVLISLFTAVTVTRSLLVFFIDSGIAKNPKLFAAERNWFGEKWEAQADTEPLKIVESSRKWFMISLATIIPGLIFLGLGGIKPNVEFRGGYEASFKVTDNSLTTAAIQEKLEAAGFRGGNVKFALYSDGSERDVIISLPPNQQLEGEKEQAVNVIASAAGLDPKTNKDYQQIGAAVQKETLRNAILGVVISSALIIVYLAFRFGVSLGNFVAGLRFGGSAIAALLHDILVVVGVAAILGFLLHWEVSALFLTAMLTIIGFSVHDTIVIFDRIRENLHKIQSGEDFGHLIDRSISRSFARSINTSMTVVVTLMILAAFGTATIDLRFFVITMLVGILSGTYSSIYNASPILYVWEKAVAKKKGEGATILAIARAENSRARVVTTLLEDRPVANTDTAGRTYGQVRRRASAVKDSRKELDE